MPNYLSTTDLVPDIPTLADHITFGTPPNLQSTDLLLLVAGSQVGGVVSVTTPGWTTIFNFNDGSGDNVLIAGYQVSGLEGATLTINFNQDMNSNELIAAVVAYRNAAMPVTSAVNFFPTAPPAPTHDVPGQIPTRIGDLYIGIGHDTGNQDDYSFVPGIVRYRLPTNDGSLCVFEIAAASTAPIPDQILVMSNGTGAVSTFSFILQAMQQRDNYKAKLMRRMLPPPYKRDFGDVIPNLLTVIGQSDNLIGGLFGKDDFLPDEG